jgi:hypothetical protein
MTFALASVIAGVAAVPAAQAQPSCAIVTDPLILLVGTWTFDMDGSFPSLAPGQTAPPPPPFASAGQFTAAIQTVNGVETPTLTITRSTSTGVSLEVISGRYQIFNDCSGGTLTVNTLSGPSKFDFWFDKFYGEIRFVSTNSGFVILGRAERIVEPDPAAGNPHLVPADKLTQYLRFSAGQHEFRRLHHLNTKHADAPASQSRIADPN